MYNVQRRCLWSIIWFTKQLPSKKKKKSSSTNIRQLMEFSLQILSIERDVVNGKCIFQRTTELGDNLIPGMEIPKEFFSSYNRESFCNVQIIEKIWNIHEFIWLTKVQAHLSEEEFQLTDTLENMGHSAPGSSASQLGGELRFKTKSCKLGH